MRGVKWFWKRNETWRRAARGCGERGRGARESVREARAAVLATGDELVRLPQTPSGAQIRESNSIMLVSLLRRLGCELSDLGIVRDDPDLIRAALLRGMEHDVLFVTGGMSMGTYDYSHESCASWAWS